MDATFLELLKGLEACIKIWNRYWVLTVLASVSAFVYFYGGVWGESLQFWVTLAAFVSLGVILIGFSAATAHLSQSRKTFEKHFAGIKENAIPGSVCNYSEIKDVLIRPSVFRVFPLTRNIPYGKFVYSIYKVLSWLISYFIPLFCFVLVGWKLFPALSESNPVYLILLAVFSILVTFAVLRAFSDDLNFSSAAKKKVAP